MSLAKSLNLAIAILMFTTLVSAKPQWEKISNNDGIVVYQDKNHKGAIVMLMAESEVDADIVKVISVLGNNKRKGEWMPNYGGTRTLKQIGMLERVEHAITDVPWPFTDRDFVFQTKAHINADDQSVLVTMKSIKGVLPPQDGLVRGEMISGDVYLKYLGPNKTFLRVKFASDPKGYMPKWIVNYASKKWPYKMIAGVKKQVEKLKKQKTFYMGDLSPKDFFKNIN